MISKVEQGRIGEQIAADFLTEQGFEILHMNWRAHHFEIDIIATKDNVLHFIEVKLRTISKHGIVDEFLAKNAVTSKKQEHLINGVQFYVDKFAVKTDVSLDLIAIDKLIDGTVNVTLYPNFIYL